MPNDDENDIHPFEKKPDDVTSPLMRRGWGNASGLKEPSDSNLSEEKEEFHSDLNRMREESRKNQKITSDLKFAAPEEQHKRACKTGISNSMGLLHILDRNPISISATGDLAGQAPFKMIEADTLLSPCGRFWKNHYRPVLSIVAILPWAYIWYMMIFFEKTCSMCAKYHEQGVIVRIFIQCFVGLVVGGLITYAYLRRKCDVPKARKVPIRFQYIVLFPLSIIVSALIGENTEDLPSGSLCVSLGVFVMCLCLMMGFHDDLDYVGTCLSSAAQVLYLIIRKKVLGLLALATVTCVVYALKEAAKAYHFKIISPEDVVDDDLAQVEHQNPEDLA